MLSHAAGLLEDIGFVLDSASPLTASG